jgi:hypothetical protein
LIGNRFYLQGQYDLWPLGPKINRGHLLVMTNHHTEFEVPRPKRSLVITRKPLGLRTDGPTNAKQYVHSSLKWGHNYIFADVCIIKASPWCLVLVDSRNGCEGVLITKKLFNISRIRRSLKHHFYKWYGNRHETEIFIKISMEDVPCCFHISV